VPRHNEPNGGIMNSQTHMSKLLIYPSMYVSCQMVLGERVKIVHKNDTEFFGYIRKTKGPKMIVFLSEKNGIFLMPIEYIKRIEER